MGKRNPLQDMRYILLDVAITFGWCIDLQEIAAGFGSQQHLHGRSANELADGGMGFHFRGELIEVEDPEEGILSGFDRYGRRLPANGAF